MQKKELEFSPEIEEKNFYWVGDFIKCLPVVFIIALVYGLAGCATQPYTWQQEHDSFAESTDTGNLILANAKEAQALSSKRDGEIAVFSEPQSSRTVQVRMLESRQDPRTGKVCRDYDYEEITFGRGKTVSSRIACLYPGSPQEGNGVWYIVAMDGRALIPSYPTSSRNGGMNYNGYGGGYYPLPISPTYMLPGYYPGYYGYGGSRIWLNGFINIPIR